MRRLIMLAAWLPLLALAAPPAAASRAPVVVILMENHEYSAIVGSPDAPYINGTLIPHGELFTNYDAVTHPSLPNYEALTVGSTCGKVGTDNYLPLCGQPSIWRQLHTAGLLGREWAENESANCSEASDSTGKYKPKHDSYAIVADARALATCGDRTLGTGVTQPGVGKLVAALGGTSPPAFSFVTPNLCDDMHSCSVSHGDAWLKANVQPLLAAGALVVVTWDEGSTKTGGGGHVATIVAGPGVVAGSRNGTAFTHYSLLAGVEDRLGLPLLGKAATARPLPLGS
jgi:phosphatidylinositol-3-phosphatase